MMLARAIFPKLQGFVHQICFKGGTRGTVTFETNLTCFYEASQENHMTLKNITPCHQGLHQPNMDSM